MRKTFIFITFFCAYTAYAQTSKPDRIHQPTLNAQHSTQLPLAEQIEQLEADKIRFSASYSPSSPEMQKIDLQIAEKKEALKRQNEMIENRQKEINSRLLTK